MSVNVLTATADELQQLLSSSGNINSQQLVQIYLSQIGQYNDYLKAVINTAPESFLLERARMLDDERKAGKIRSPLHGIPILLKDNIATNSSTSLDTTAGSLGLVDSKPRINAAIVDRLLDAGLIIIGKASLSELAYWKGTNLNCGWNAVTGQAQSPYVKGGFLPDDTVAGHSNPGGSSSGPAISVAAGFAPISVGTETFGSLVFPAGRAAVYSLKPGRALISVKGIVPISNFSDQPGPIAKTAKDLAVLLDILADGEKNIPSGGYISHVTGLWDGLNIGTLDPTVWNFPPEARKILDESMEQQLIDQIKDAYQVIKQHAPVFQNNVPLVTADVFTLDGSNLLLKIFEKDFKGQFENYLTLLDTPQVHSLGELIDFNNQHADAELPPGVDGNQDVLEQSENTTVTAEDRATYIAYLQEFACDQGLDEIFTNYNLNIIVGPAESPLYYFAAACGYPIASVPVGYLDFNGRPHGFSAIAHDEGRLIQFQSAFEGVFPPRIPPALNSIGA